jgi:chromosome segregation ATPase
MEAEICKLKHENIDKQLKQHDKKLKEHDDLFDKQAENISSLKNSQSVSDVKIENLCDQIKSLVTAIKWLVGMVAVELVGFFFWYIKNIPMKG